MIKLLIQIVSVGLLCGQLIVTGCVSTPTISKKEYAPFLDSRPISEEALQKISKESPKDAVFAELLQAFALMRRGDLHDVNVRKTITGLLETSVSSFEDMSDPVNFSKAFTVDESKPFRGRPHERMFSSMMAGVFHMGENRCDQALPYFRNGEFLDARFQKMPIGTDTPAIYALIYRCLLQMKAQEQDLRLARAAVFRSVRFLTMQETLVEALQKTSIIDLRNMAIANRMAYLIFEISIYHSLLTAPDHFVVDNIVDDAAQNAGMFITLLRDSFSDEYKTRMRPHVVELARVYGMNSKKGIIHLEQMSFAHIQNDAKDIGQKLKALFAHHTGYRARARDDAEKTSDLSNKIFAATSADKMIVSFSGMGPSLVRRGSYQEISLVKPSVDANPRPAIRGKSLKINTSCGFHRTDTEGGFALVHCKPGASISSSSRTEVLPSLELMSLSRKATTAQGRKFDEVLKGRAQFRAATEKVAEISAWSALFLFYMGSALIDDCQRSGQGQACYAKGLALWAVAGVTIVFSGTAWLIGRAQNPAADSRYIHLMYESVYLSI